MNSFFSLPTVYFQTAVEWRTWLAENHDKQSEIWLIFYKKETGKPTIAYNSAVEEALCFGWIDSIIKSIDKKSYARKFTPRKDTSKWSDSNKKRVVKLIKNGRMTPAGMAKVTIAKQNGRWDKPDRPTLSLALPEAFKNALEKNQKAKDNFYRLAPSYRKHYLGWIRNAKRSETIKKRIIESIRLLERGEKLGLR